MFLFALSLSLSLSLACCCCASLALPPPFSAANWLKPPDVDQKKRHAPRYLTRAYWHNNSRKLLFLCLYACLSLLLFVGAMLQHSQGGAWYMVAKGCGQCLNFNCTFVMVRPGRHTGDGSGSFNSSHTHNNTSETILKLMVTNFTEDKQKQHI